MLSCGTKGDSAGDTLRAVGSQSTEFKTLSQLSEMILGPMGSDVVLHLRGESGDYVVKLERGSGPEQVIPFCQIMILGKHRFDITPSESMALDTLRVSSAGISPG